jgi:hypothetical protein
MPSPARPLDNLPELPEDPTDKATLRVEASADRGRHLAFGMVVPGRDTVACARLGAAVVIGVGGPIATIYEAHSSGFPASWTAGIACAQVICSVILGVTSRRGTRS